MGSQQASRRGTGIEGAAEVFAVAAWLIVAFGLLCLDRGWFAPLSGHPFVLLGFELAVLSLTLAVVCLAVDPHAPRRAWLAGGVSLLLVAVGMLAIVPRLLAP